MILYTSPTCKYCPAIKLALAAKFPELEVRDVAEPKWRKLLVEDMKMLFVPVLVERGKVYAGKDSIEAFIETVP